MSPTTDSPAFDVLTDDRYKDRRLAFRNATHRATRAVEEFRPVVTTFAACLASGAASTRQAEELIRARSAISAAMAEVDSTLDELLQVTGVLRVAACAEATDAGR